MSDRERRRMCADERNALMNYAVGVDALTTSMKGLEKRLKDEKLNGQVKGALGIVRKTYEGLLETMPVEQLQTMRRNLQLMVWEYHVRNIMGRKDIRNDGLWMPLDKLDELVDAARDRCLSCMKKPDEARKCVLAKAFDLLPLKNEDESLNGCRYYFEL